MCDPENCPFHFFIKKWIVYNKVERQNQYRTKYQDDMIQAVERAIYEFLDNFGVFDE